jgi:OOP family OmpA-OmpF porin
MKRTIKAFVSTAALAALSAHAQNITSSTSTGPGPYVGASIAQGRYSGPAVGGLDTDKSGTGGKIYGGYELTPNIAIEAGYADLGKAESAAGSVRGRGVFLDAVGKVPLGQSFSALARIGAFNGRGTSDLGDGDRKTEAKYGLGVQYDFSPRTFMRGEWERYRFDTVSGAARTNLYSVGLNYKF